MTELMSPEALRARVLYAQELAKSNLLPASYARQPANVLIAVEAAAALRIPPIQALTSVVVVNGRPTLSSDLMAALVRRAGHTLRIVEDEEKATVTATLIRADDPEFSFTVTWNAAKAQRAKLWGSKGPWSLYPNQMLRARAISEVCRQGASDVLTGMIYTPEEKGANVDADGMVIVDEPQGQQAPRLAAPAPQSAPQASLPAQQAPSQHASAELVAAIHEWAEALEMPAEKLAEGVAWASRRRTLNASELTVREAETLLSRLRKRAEQLAQAAPAPHPKPAPEPEPEPVQGELIDDVQDAEVVYDPETGEVA